jgi:hypothetical protein
MGPEDVLGSDAYGMWQYGKGAGTAEKNLQYMAHIEEDPDTAKAVDFFCIHGFAQNGVARAAAEATQWDWWRQGWTERPAKGLPRAVKGFTYYDKKSWMTETSGEEVGWRVPGSGFPGRGAWSIALKIQQALTAGRESAWLYWQLSNGKPVSVETLTDWRRGGDSPKYVAAKHFFRFVRPGAVRVDTTITGSATLLTSAYVHDAERTLVVELVNTSESPVSVNVVVPPEPRNLSRFDVVTSSDGHLWQTATVEAAAGKVSVEIPGYGIATLEGGGR